MKPRALPPAAALRSTTLPWNAREVLPLDRPERRRRARENKSNTPDQAQVWILVDILAEDAELSKTKARLAIQNGLVSVDDVIVRDPDTRLNGPEVIRYFPTSKIHVGP